MPFIKEMPALQISSDELKLFGVQWAANNESLSRTPPYSSGDLTRVFDQAVGKALEVMLGDIGIQRPNASSLLPPSDNCVEVGDVRIIGGVRAQNFDVGYRPDGTRIAFDSKTLNDRKSVQKNYQNMINDLGTEATTVHTRFPYAVVAFLVAIPEPCLCSPQKEALTSTLERLAERNSPLDSAHKAEAISLVVWAPGTGEICSSWPPPESCLRVEKFSDLVHAAYVNRYKGLPPHDSD